MRAILWRPCRRARGKLLPVTFREVRCLLDGGGWLGSREVPGTKRRKGGKRPDVVTEGPKSRSRGGCAKRRRVPSRGFLAPQVPVETCIVSRLGCRSLDDAWHPLWTHGALGFGGHRNLYRNLLRT